MEINKFTSKWYLVEYIDAAYLYDDQIKKMNGIIDMPPSLKTIAHKIEYTTTSIFLHAGSQKKEYKYVIPKGVVKNITEIICDANTDCCLGNEVYPDLSNLNNFNTKNIEGVRIGQKISVNWDDIRFTNSKSELKIPTSMHIEGLYAGYYGDFLYVYNPVNVNVEKGISHPQKKADLYAIPFNVISKFDVINEGIVETPKYQFQMMKKSCEAKIKMIDHVVGFISDDTGKLFVTMNGFAYLDEI